MASPAHGAMSPQQQQQQPISISPKRKRGRSSVSEAKEKKKNMTKTVVMLPNSPTKAAADELQGKLFPSQEECSKLASVVRMLDKHGVGTETLPEEAGVPSLLDALEASNAIEPHSLPLIDFYLDLAVSAAKRRLREAPVFFSSSSPKKRSSSNGQHQDSSMLSSSPEASTSRLPTDAAIASKEKEVDQFAVTVRTILEELKESAAKRLGVKRIKNINTPKYALHRTIGDYDVFSSASDIVPDDDTAWQKLHDTDVLALYPTELAEQATNAEPRLADLVLPQPTLTKRPVEQQPHIEPVAFLYYDAYQSFAPTYDSSIATLSYAQSVTVRTARDAAEDWTRKDLPPVPPLESAGKLRQPLGESLANLDPELFSPDDMEELRQYLRSVEESAVIDKRLQENTELLRVLQEAQWARLRQAETTASQTELQSARRLLASLTSLANARPRTPDLATTSPWSSASQAAARIVQNKARPYYGTLDRHNHRGIPDYVMSKEGDDEPDTGAGSTEMGRKNSNQGGKKVKRSHKSKAQQAAAAAKAAAKMLEPVHSQL